jgi:hypothetical protein
MAADAAAFALPAVISAAMSAAPMALIVVQRTSQSLPIARSEGGGTGHDG